MNQLAQSDFIASIGPSSSEDGLDAAAKSAAKLASRSRRDVLRKKALTAQIADTLVNGTQTGEARAADREARNFDERSAADAAI
jgi:hypothetical protein